MEKQPNRIPCESLDFVEASHRHRVYPLMYCHMEIIGHLDIERLKQSVSLSSEIVPEILCAYDFKKNCFVDLGYTANDVVRYTAENMTSVLQQDLDSHPQFQIFIISQRNHELVIAVMSHMAVLSDEQEMEQVSAPDSPILTSQELKILPRRRQVYINNQEVSLTTREFDVLYYLARHAGQVLTAQQIYEAVSSESAVGCDYHCIESSIYSIRKKLGRDVIFTVRGYGYKFNKNI